MFGTILLALCTLMHLYVFWRVASVPSLARRLPPRFLVPLGLVLWIILVLGRVVGHDGQGTAAMVLEFLGMNWMGTLFLLFVCLLAADLATLFGLLMPRRAPALRGWALLAGVLLAFAALFQGLRAPVILRYDVTLPGLPRSLDGTVIAGLSDMHLGSLLGPRWLEARLQQVGALRPDLVVLLGDIFEGHGSPPAQFITAFQHLDPPLGVWAVPGNHEFHGGSDMRLFEDAHFTLLRGRWVEPAPGLVLAGVDDLTFRHRRGQRGDPIRDALAGGPAEAATILLSHTPWQTGRAAELGAGLMLSGHTHGGQIWPFDYLVRQVYPLIEGRYDVDGMTLIVSRGTGTWGPRMRLWEPGEILCITLLSGA